MPVFDRAEWQPMAEAHRRRANSLLADVDARRCGAQAHPIEDFLFVYYQYRPNQLRRWHPGAGIGLTDSPHAQWSGYRVADGVASVDLSSFAARRGAFIQFLTRLLRSTVNRSGSFGCFGMHEWAMVYRQQPGDVRHDAWPLRLSPSRIAETVDNATLRCTHFDAFRFFTAEARPLNQGQLRREDQIGAEQPGCLHANMDLYKWAYKLAPATPSDLVLDCFELAMDIRYVDMQASPYDFTSLGVHPIEVDTAAGRAQYATQQREFARRAEPLRRRLLTICEALTEPSDLATASM